MQEESKRCPRCGETKPFFEFYVRAGSADGHRAECKVCLRAKQLAYNELHRAARAAYGRAHYQKNADRRKAWQRQNYREFTDEYRERGRLWYQRNLSEARAAGIARARRWAKTFPEAARAKSRKSRHIWCARKRSALVDRVVSLRVYERDRWLCGICGSEIGIGLRFPHPQSASLDHIIPLARGGMHSYANVQAAHLLCNTKKGARYVPEAPPLTTAPV